MAKRLDSVTRHLYKALLRRWVSTEGAFPSWLEI